MIERLAAIDLNLLVALHVLLEERSVTRAARRLGVGQPAVSHALGKLRALFDDPLLGRARGGLVPTPRGAQLAIEVRRVLGDLDAALHRAPSFDPATSRRHFTIVTSEYGELCVLPGLLARLHREAPQVRITTRRAPMRDLEQFLESHSIDLVISPGTVAMTAARRQQLLTDRYVCLVRREHPVRELTLDAFVALDHALFAPRGGETGCVDDELAKLGRNRHVALATPSAAIAVHMVGCTDIIVTLPEQIARAYAHCPVRVLELPLDVPRLALVQYWHEHVDGDPGHVWLRGLVHEVARTLQSSGA